METYSVVTPGERAVSVQELRDHLHLNDDAEDAALGLWIDTAELAWSHETGHVLSPGTYRLSLDGWPGCEHWERSQSGYGERFYLDRHGPLTIRIDRRPVTAATVSYLDTAGVWQVLDAGSYTTDLQGLPARVLFADGVTLPELHASQRPRVRVTFQAGAEDADPRAKSAVLLLAAHYYRHREAYGEVKLAGVPHGWHVLASHFRSGLLPGANRGCR